MQSTVVLLSLVVVALTSDPAWCYPYGLHQQRKADPFVALANTLRQEQEQEALQEEQQQQQQQQQQQGVDSGYYYDPSDDDLYQMSQFQRQLSRAAVAPFFSRAQRGGSWGQVALDDPQYGYPVGGDWYDADDEGVVVREQEEEAAEEEEQRRQEGQLLLDMLAEYMLEYGQQSEVKRAGSENATTTTTAAPATTPHRPEKQPPVRKGQDGTPLGQQEFPMMRPATPQRNQWLAATHMLQEQEQQRDGEHFRSGPDASNKKRHVKGKNLAKKSSIVTSEDELINELDNLKMKKN